MSKYVPRPWFCATNFCSRITQARAAEVDGHIYICTEGGFSGSCTNYGFFANSCTNFPSGFDNQISSMGPDKGWFCITFVYVVSCPYVSSLVKLKVVYRNYNCDYSGYTYTVTNPGYSSLPPGIDNNLSSIICYRQ